MEDTLSVKSNESVATSDEFEYIGGDKPAISKTPTLDVKNGDLNQLKINLTEALKESCIGMSMHPEHFSNNDNEPENQLKNEERSEPNVFPMDLENTAARGENISRKNSSEGNCERNLSDTGKKVGHSTFYGCIVEPGKDPLTSQDTKDFTASNPTSDEKKDSEKLDPCCEDYYYQEDVDQDCTIFSGVTYLGAANINAPKSECEIQRNMAIFNEQSCESGAGGIKVSVSVPCSSQGFVVLYDALSNSVISRYEIHRILFYARGPVDSPESGCFAFTWSHGDTQESAIFQCHIFKCDIAEAVSRVSACFAKAFQRVPRSMSSSVHSSVNAADLMSGSITTLPDVARTLMYVFEVNLEIKEDDGKGTFSAVGKDKNGFKLKTNTEKQLCLSIRQVSDNGPQLHIERCFGILIAPGRHVRHSDMQLLEMDQTSSNGGTSAATTTATNPHTEKTSASNNGNNSNSNTNNSATSNLTQVSASWDPTEASFEPLNTETAKDQKQYMTVAVDLVIRGIQEPVRFQMETAVRIVGQNELRNFWYFQRKSLVQQFYLNLKEVVSPDLNDIYYEVLSMETSGELDRNLLNLNLNLSSLIQSPSITSIDTITPSKEEYSSDGDEPLLSGTGLVSKDCSEDVLESWADVLNKWKLTRQPPKQLSGLVRLGIPEALRGEVWQRLAGVEENNEIMENYRLLITKESSCENVIKRDIARTFPAHDFFKEAGGLGQDSLYRVSKAYAVYDSEVGYCQGLSFLAATLLLHMPEEQAFCVLVKLMYDYGLRDLYKDGFDNLYLRLHQLNCLMEEQLAVLWQHFKDHHVETHMFASQWFLTLFTARFPLYFVFHIIDVVLLQGIETLFQVALALLMLCKKDLLQLDFEGILKYFRVSLPKKCRTEESAKQLIKLACNIKVKKLKKYEADFIAHKDKAETEEKMRQTLVKYEEEKKWMQEKIQQLKKQADQAEMEKKNSQIIINDYKLVRQRLDAQLTSVKNELDELKAKISNCENCGKYTAEEKPEKMQNQLLIKNDDGLERVRELELELAQTKLAHVEAECKNQDLIHQLRSTELELTTAKNSWPPWLSKTLSSIKEVANKKDFSNFPPLSTQQNNHHSNTNHQSNSNTAPTFVSHINQSVMSRRESAPSNINNSATLPQVTRPAPPLISTKSQSFAENSKQQLKKSARNFCENKNASFDRKNDAISQRSSSLKDRKFSARDDQSRRRDSATLPAGAQQQTSSVGRAVSSHGTTNLGLDSTVVKNSSVIIKDSQSVSSSLKSASAQN